MNTGEHQIANNFNINNNNPTNGQQKLGTNAENDQDLLEREQVANIVAREIIT